SPWILHLATHGFFLRDQEYDPDLLLRERPQFFAKSSGLGQFLEALSQLLLRTESSGSEDDGRSSRLPLDNPLLRSGLALAGANWMSKKFIPPPEAEDGILTAEDVAGLDLVATELAVLSACDTGLGQVHVGEGVFGMRRAFVLAGARTLVMSLWKVSD